MNPSYRVILWVGQCRIRVEQDLPPCKAKNSALAWAEPLEECFAASGEEGEYAARMEVECGIPGSERVISGAG